MKSVFSLYKFKMNIALRSAVLVIPTVLTLTFLWAMYSVTPIQVSVSILLSGFFLFAISVFLSMMIQMKENDIQEEVLLYHSRSKINYYISRELVLVSIVLVYAVILLLYPMIRSFLNSGFFTRQLKPEDVIYGGLILIGSGFCGIALGDLFHHRIFSHIRYALIGVIFVSLLAVCKYGLADTFSGFKILHVITPPIMDGFRMVGKTDVFDKVGSLKIFAHMLIFTAAAVIIKIKLLCRNLWRV